MNKTINTDDIFDPTTFTKKLVNEVYKKASKYGIHPLDDRFEVALNTMYDKKNHLYNVEAYLRLRSSEHIKMKDIENDMLKKFDLKMEELKSNE